LCCDLLHILNAFKQRLLEPFLPDSSVVAFNISVLLRMTRWRRLVRDYERRIDVSNAMILVAMGANLIRRNAHP
jgi:hypothetical protein